MRDTTWRHYRRALRNAFIGLLTSWTRIPGHGHVTAVAARECGRAVLDLLAVIGVLLFLVLGPVLALLAPLFALWVLRREQREAAWEEAWRAEVAEQYGGLAQRQQQEGGGDG